MSYNKKRFVFTLIELLVVLSMIAMLLGFLLPALNNVKNVTYKLVCLNNMNESYKKISLYTINNSSKIPLVNAQTGGIWGSWGTTLYDEGLADSSAENLYCPMTEPPEPTASDEEFRVRQYIYSVNYSSLFKGVQNHASYTWGTHSQNIGLDFLKIEDPTEYVILIDGKRTGNPLGLSKFWRTGTSGSHWSARPWTIHSDDDSTHTAFADGHVAPTHILELRDNIHTSIYPVFDPYESW